MRPLLSKSRKKLKPQRNPPAASEMFATTFVEAGGIRAECRPSLFRPTDSGSELFRTTRARA